MKIIRKRIIILTHLELGVFHTRPLFGTPRGTVTFLLFVLGFTAAFVALTFSIAKCFQEINCKQSSVARLRLCIDNPISKMEF